MGWVQIGSGSGQDWVWIGRGLDRRAWQRGQARGPMATSRATRCTGGARCVGAASGSAATRFVSTRGGGGGGGGGGGTSSCSAGGSSVSGATAHFSSGIAAARDFSGARSRAACTGGASAAAGARAVFASGIAVLEDGASGVVAKPKASASRARGWSRRLVTTRASEAPPTGEESVAWGSHGGRGGGGGRTGSIRLA